MLIRLRRALLQTLFHLLYHQFAWAYDVVSAAVSLGRWQQWGAAALPYLPGARVLDLGHGPGHLLVAMSEQSWHPVGLDLSPQMGRIARRRLRRHNLLNQLVRGRGQYLPFAGATFDGVTAVFPAPYILLPQTTAEIWRVLRPGGRLVVVPEAELTGVGALTRAVEWLYVITGQRRPTRDNDSDLDALWRDSLVGAGFAVTVHFVRQEGGLVSVVVAERPEAS